MEKKQQIILIIVGVLLFLLGLIVGIIFQQQGGVQSVKIETANNLLSKVVSSVTAYGKIENINGKIPATHAVQTPAAKPPVVPIAATAAPFFIFCLCLYFMYEINIVKETKIEMINVNNIDKLNSNQFIVSKYFGIYLIVI